MTVPIQTRIEIFRRRISAWAGRLFAQADANPTAIRRQWAESLPCMNSDWPPPTGQDRLRTLANSLPHAMVYQVVLRPNGLRHFTYVSESIRHLHEVSPDAALADPKILYGQVLPESLSTLLAAEERALRTRSPFHCELACRLPSGRIRWLELNSIPNPLPDGTLAWDGLEVDITQRKQAQQAQRAGEEEFRAFFETAMVGAAQIDPATHRFIHVNDRYCQIVGYSREELLERTFLDITHPQDRQANRLQFDRVMRGDCEDYFFQKRYIRKDGQEIWVQVSLSVIRDEQGRAVRACGVVQDITEANQTREQLDAALAQADRERKRLQAVLEELRHSEARFRAAYEHAAVGMEQLALDGTLVDANRRLCEMLGYTREELIGRRVEEVTSPLDRSRDAENLARLLAGEITSYSLEKQYVHATGRPVWVRLSSSLTGDPRDPATRRISVIEDITHDKQAEDALRRSEQRFRSLVQATAAIVWDTPASGEYVTEQPGWSAFTGQTFEQLEGWGWLDAVHPDDRQHAREVWAKAVAEKSYYQDEHRLRRHDGAYRHMIARAIPILGEDGQVREWIGVHNDVEDLKQAEESFRTLADNIAQFAWMADEKGSLFWYNKRWYDYTGTTLEEMRARGWQRLHHPDHADRVDKKLRHCFETGTVWEDTFPIRGKDGEYRWFLSQAVPIRDENGRVLRWFGTNTDITEQREAEQRLRESRALYRSRLAELQTIYRSAPIGLCVVDRDFRYVRINDHLAEINGLSAAEHIGRTVREVVPDVADQEEPHLRQAIKTGKPIIDTEVSGETRAMPGFKRHWLVSYYPLPNDAGEIVGVNITAQEITDRKRAEEQRQSLLEAEQAARAEAERYNRLKDEFLATVSHELRSPLNAILGWTRLLAQGKAEAGRALEIVERNASGLAQIVEDLLDMSRIISGKVHLNRSTADLAPLAGSVMESVQLAAQAKGIDLQAWIDPNLRPIICDPNRVQQIIWNLLTNAVKFTPAGGQVWLRIAQLADGVNITVQDTGQGIPADYLAQIFGRFQQVDSSITRKHGGLGLGLSITRHLVELHGGTIWAASQGQNKGATFTVQLPSYQPSEPEGSDQLGRGGSREPARLIAEQDVQNLLYGISVLVVDDDPDSCELAARILRDTGATVHLAESAEQGFEMLMDLRPDVLISDISMPQQDGYAFARKVRACGGWCVDLICVALTALARPEDRAGALQAGYDEYLTKPFDATALSVLVSTLTRARRPRFRRDVVMESNDKRISSNNQERKKDSGKPHVLLAEDNATISEMLRLFLESGGYSVSTAPTVQQALEIAQREHVDVLLSDFRLKDGTGWQLMERLRAHNSVPGVMLSGYSDPFYIEKSKAAGFCQYLVKPVEEDQLLQAIHAALNDHASQSHK